MMESIAYAIGGGALIGLSASWLLLAKGRIAGISGIVGGLLGPKNEHTGWRLAFVVGLLAGGALLVGAMPETIAVAEGRSIGVMAVAGLLVGYGTRLGNGCTSGHGICGLTRFSARSGVATLTFMATGALSATLFGLFGGGA